MKGDYGLRAMLDMAAYYGQGPIESADIASRQYIPEQYLDQILMVLRKEGLVKSVRWPKGGHHRDRRLGLVPAEPCDDRAYRRAPCRSRHAAWQPT